MWVIGRPADAFHGVLQTVDAHFEIHHRTATQASALLRVFDGVLVGVVGFLTNGDAIFHQNFIHATRSASMQTRQHFPFAPFSGRFGLLVFGLYVVSAAGKRGACAERSHSGGARGDEIATAYAIFRQINALHRSPFVVVTEPLQTASQYCGVMTLDKALRDSDKLLLNSYNFCVRTLGDCLFSFCGDACSIIA